MSVWAVSLVKDEADIIETTVRHMASQVDRVLVADNGSTDGTLDLLYSMDIEVVEDREPGYYQSVKMSNLAEMAREQGAGWVVPFDADELWLPDEGTIAEVLTSLPPEAMVCEATVFDHVAVPGETLSPWRRSQPLPLRKVACRAVEGLVIHQGNHDCAIPDEPHPLRAVWRLQVRHFPYRSPEQFIRKVRNGAAAYRATDLDESVGAHWRAYDEMDDDGLREHFYRWFHEANPDESELVHDPEPLRSLFRGATAPAAPTA